MPIAPLRPMSPHALIDGAGHRDDLVDAEGQRPHHHPADGSGGAGEGVATDDSNGIRSQDGDADGRQAHDGEDAACVDGDRAQTAGFLERSERPRLPRRLESHHNEDRDRGEADGDAEEAHLHVRD